MENNNKNKELSNLNIRMSTIDMAGKYHKASSKFIEPYYEENDEGYFLNAYVQYPEILHKFHTIFTWKNGNWQSWKAFYKFLW